MPAPNERFCEMAGVCPQKRQCKFATAYPAATSVNPATSQSRHHVSGNPVDTAARQSSEKNSGVKIINY